MFYIFRLTERSSSQHVLLRIFWLTEYRDSSCLNWLFRRSLIRDLTTLFDNVVRLSVGSSRNGRRGTPRAIFTRLRYVHRLVIVHWRLLAYATLYVAVATALGLLSTLWESCGEMCTISLTLWYVRCHSGYYALTNSRRWVSSGVMVFLAIALFFGGMAECPRHRAQTLL